MRVYDNNGDVLMDISFIIYSKSNCVFCDKAKALLNKNNVSFIEFRITPKNRDLTLAELTEKIGSTPKTVPVIFDNEWTYIGGYEQLEALFHEKSV